MHKSPQNIWFWTEKIVSLQTEKQVQTYTHMGLFDFLFGDDSAKNEGIDQKYFGRDKFGYYADEENLYEDDSTWQDDDF